VALSNGNGTFQPIQPVIDDFAYNAGGWRVEMHSMHMWIRSLSKRARFRSVGVPKSMHLRAASGTGSELR
jgi:hypothetical protein